MVLQSERQNLQLFIWKSMCFILYKCHLLSNESTTVKVYN